MRNPARRFSRLFPYLLPYLLPCLLVAASGRADARLILSEAMADPAGLSDAQGEFLELANVGGDSLRLDTLELGVDGSIFQVASVAMAPGSLLLLCRDSASMAIGSVRCSRQLPGLSLANGRPVSISIMRAGVAGNAAVAEEYSVPAARPGVSWENSMDASADYRIFLPSAGPWLQGDSATPGQRNSRSVETPRSDLGLSRLGIEPGRALAAEIHAYGSGPQPHSFLSIRLDEDWDGEWETLLDSMELPQLPGGVETFFTPLPSGMRGLVRARLSYDENPANNEVLLHLDAGASLIFGEWCPEPDSGSPEWVEIRNATAEAGGQGRILSLAQVAFNGRALGERAGVLAPGEYLVLTESIPKFLARYGSLKVRLWQLPSWPGLRNTGDTLRLSAAGFPIDSAAYAAGDLNGAGGCLRPGKAGLQEAPGTPGFTEAVAERLAWKLSGRIAGGGRTLDVEVLVPGGIRYALRVFDLDGNRLRDLGGGGPGRHLHRWAGEDARGRALDPGLYLLCLSVDGHRAFKEAVAVVADR